MQKPTKVILLFLLVLFVIFAIFILLLPFILLLGIGTGSQ
jgi:hypothetical protein